jgi:WD40 repeat protein
VKENHLRRILHASVSHDNAGRPHLTLGPGIPQPPSHLTVAGDNQTLATASNDKTARLWDISLGQQSPTFGESGEPIAAAVFSPDGASVVLALTNGTVVLADARTFTESRRLPNNSVALEGGAFSPDGKWFQATARGR